MAKTVRQRFPYTDSHWSRPKTETEWHAERKGDVTATDSAALFGVSPYATMFELFHTKAGTLKVEFEETDRMRWGKRLQNAIAVGICEDNGWRIVSDHPYLYVRSARFVGMGASPDFVVHCPKRGVGLLEIKNVDRFIAKDQWSDDEAPVHIEFQLQHQLECAALPWGCIGGLIGGNEAMTVIRDRDLDVGTEIGNRVTDLWRRVRDNDPPTPNYLADFDTIKRLYKHADVGKALDLTDPLKDEASRLAIADRLGKLCAAERDAALRGKFADEDRKRAQAEILTIIDDAESVLGVPGFNIRAATQHREARTQEVRATSFRDLRISVPKPPKGAKTPAEAAPVDADHQAAA